MPSPTPKPQRGEIWYADLEPTRGAELQKIRPVVVISANGLARLPLYLVVPLTGWNTAFSGRVWLVRIEPSATNGLAKTSAADVFQMRSIDELRFGMRCTGHLSPAQMHEITSALTIVVAHETI